MARDELAVNNTLPQKDVHVHAISYTLLPAEDIVYELYCMLVGVANACSYLLHQ